MMVAVAMSGGVDSSTAAALLAEQKPLAGNWRAKLEWWA